jgi:hypothetical protein
VRRRCLDRQERPAHVDADFLIPDVDGLVERRVRCEVGAEAGTGYQHVDAAQLVDRRLDRIAHLVAIGDVGSPPAHRCAELRRGGGELGLTRPSRTTRPPACTMVAAIARPMPPLPPVIKARGASQSSRRVMLRLGVVAVEAAMLIRLPSYL